MQRARSVEAKQERRQAIINATRRCFDAHGPDLTLDQVASTAGLTRTTLYGYVATREEVLLLLIAEELTEWAEAVQRSLPRLRAPSGVARVVADRLVEHSRVAPLLGLCGIVVERNVSPDGVLAWKHVAHECIVSLGAGIDQTLNTPVGSGARFLLHTYSVATGLHTVAFPTTAAAKAIADGGLTELTIDFATELRIALLALAQMLLVPKHH
jgi:AcrR family transcriptional regulator